MIWNFIKSWILPIAGGLALAFIIMQFVFTTVGVDGASMSPTMSSGERVGVFRLGSVQRGSIVVFDATQEDPGINQDGKTGQKYYVKRVIGVPGDTISSSDGNLYVNNKLVNQNYLTSEERTTGTGNWNLNSLSQGLFKTDTSHWIDGPATKVPDGQYFVLGDNRLVSEDSRYFGFVKKEHIMGTVVVFPWTQNANIINGVKFFATN